jgi:hypothetical protein
MNRCETCKHWRAFEEPKDIRGQEYDVEIVNRLGLCERIGMLNHQTELDANGYRNCLQPKTDVLAAVEDLSDHCFLRTRAEFGCVLWESST